MWLSGTTQRRKLRLVILGSLVSMIMGLLLSATPAQASGDDYTWKADNSQTADPWGFTKRQCVSFVAFRMAQSHHALTNSTQHWDHATHWYNTALALHKTVTWKPKIGAVAQWKAGESSHWTLNGRTYYMQADSTYGHVAYVSWVFSDGTVQIEQYNMGGNRLYSSMRVRAPRYIYVF